MTADQIDVYYGPSNYTAEMGTDYFSLRITIVADSRLETSELLSILIVEPVMPYDELGDPISPPQTDIIIIDDDGKLSINVTCTVCVNIISSHT